MKEIKHTAIIGMGALGILYGKHIMEACGQNSVTYLMDEDRLARHSAEEYSVNGEAIKLRMAAPQDSAPCSLLIIAVKYTGFEAILPMIKQAAGPDTIVISVMNGIASEDTIAEVLGRKSMIYTVPQGMDAMRFGSALRYTQMGKLHLGITSEESREDLESLISFFDRIRMPYVREEDIMYRMWFKYMLNVGVNQMCMAYNTTYKGVTEPGKLCDTMKEVMREVKVIANAKGIKLTEADIDTCIEIEKTLDPDGTPSMGQDRIGRRPSEVDMFAGTVIRLGRELGIPTPANEMIYAKVKEIEKEYVK